MQEAGGHGSDVLPLASEVWWHGYLAPSDGEARIGGFDLSTDRLKAAEILGYLPESGPLYREMTPESFLKYAGQTRLMPPSQLAERLDYVTDQCGLGEVWGKAISKLSRGYRQRVGMAHTLLHDPDVLILDEPTNHLDIDAQEAVESTLSQFPGGILFVSHDRAFTDALADDVVQLGER